MNKLFVKIGFFCFFAATNLSVMNHDIFISYSSNQKSIADGVCQYFEENGISCWMDSREISSGDSYGDLIEEAIKNSKAFVFVFSGAASFNERGGREVEFAFAENKPVLPFRVDESCSYEYKLHDLLDKVIRLLGFGIKTKAKCPEGAVGGLFSVGPSVRVRFSKGNLQYHPLENEWRFAEHQYDMIGKLNRKIAHHYNGWIDLFGWGTGVIPTRMLEDGGRYDVFEEWGCNSISNGGNARHPWRTLTNKEWDFVFGKRHPNSGIRYVKATVNGVKGVILFPDEWDAPTGDLTGLNNKRSGFNSNIISDVEWASRFESNNAVFLPVTGVRVGERIYDLDADDYGYYWSSEGCESNEVAYCMEFSGRTMDANFPQGRCNGLGVRLVCPE